MLIATNTNCKDDLAKSAAGFLSGRGGFYAFPADTKANLTYYGDVLEHELLSLELPAEHSDERKSANYHRYIVVVTMVGDKRESDYLLCFDTPEVKNILECVK